MLEEGREAPQRPAAAETFEAYDTAYPSMVCAGCNCLCDDISFFVKDGRVVRTLNQCEMGAAQLATLSDEGRAPPLSPADLRKAIERAAAVLRAHGPALVLGADALDEASMQGSWDLAGRLRGLWIPRAFPELCSFYQRVKTFGWATALLDEVRDQAELVLFWRADPLVTHHRHLSRYSFFARGRFTERGHHDRNLAAVAAERTPIEPLCQQFFILSATQETSFVRALTAPQPTGGFDHRDFPSLARALARAAYVALFLDPGQVAAEVLDALFEWSNRLNAQGRKRVVLLPLWNAGVNMEGFCQRCLEGAAAAWGADFSAGFPEAAQRAVDWEALAGRVGSVLLTAPPPGRAGAAALAPSLAGRPRVLIDPYKTASASAADVVIPAGLPGIEHDGVFVRADGLPLKASRLDALADRGYPSAERVFLELLREVG